MESTTRDAPMVSGAAEVRFALRDGATRLAYLHQHNPLRALFPTPEPDEGAALAVLVTTSGGLVAGDQIAISVSAEGGTIAQVVTAAAEKIYRSAGATTQISQTMDVDDGAWLEYLPLETILFDGARLRRHTKAILSTGAGFLGGGIIVFGRRARGERFTHGLLHDQLEVCREGALVWGDALHLEGNVAALMDHPACLDGAAACATLVLMPRENEPARFVDGARAVLQRLASPELRGGVTAVNGLAVTRWLAVEPAALRRAFVELACHWREAAAGLPARLPRLWHI